MLCGVMIHMPLNAAFGAEWHKYRMFFPLGVDEALAFLNPQLSSEGECVLLL